MIRSAWSDEIRKHGALICADTSATMKCWHRFLCQEIWSFPRWFIPLFIAVLALRIFYCVQAPLSTSDLFRHLGFTSHLFDDPKHFYYLVPTQFSSELWASNWASTVYIYPPVILLFFSLFAKLGLGFFWVKLVLTLTDVLTCILIGRSTCWIAAILFFVSPVSVWFSSHEGQYESLVNFLVVISVISARKGAWKTAGIAFMLALQAKQFGLLIFPYLIFEVFNRDKSKQLRSIKGLVIGILIGFVPFLPFYYWRSDILLLPFEAKIAGYNPFFWPILWNHSAVLAHFAGHTTPRILFNATTTLLPLILIGFLLLRGRFWWKLPQALPAVSFYCILKSLGWGMCWYLNMVPGLVLAMWRHRVTVILILIINCFTFKDYFEIIRCDRLNQDPKIKQYYERLIWFADYQMHAD